MASLAENDTVKWDATSTNYVSSGQVSDDDQFQQEDSGNPYVMGPVGPSPPSSAHILNGRDDEEEGDEEDRTRKSSGEIQVSLHYDHDDKTFRVHIHKAVQLVPVSGKSSARPYAKVYLTSASRQIGKRKTKVR